MKIRCLEVNTMVKAIVGANWGDEGKGKITDMLAVESDVVVRFQGGSNAGHTIINNHGKFALHMLPSGVFYQHVTNVLGPGVALNIEVLISELKALEEKGVPRPNILISDRAEVVMPWHITLDNLRRRGWAAGSLALPNRVLRPFTPINTTRLVYRCVTSIILPY